MPVIAQAHPGHDAGASFASGILHPLTGLDHLLALIAVGLLAARMGGGALLAIPSAFLTLLMAGVALGFSGVRLEFVEPAIVASILICGGLALLPPQRMPIATTGLAALFALFHGNAHGIEAVTALERAHYAAGLAVSSAAVLILVAWLGSLPARAVSSSSR